MHIIVLNYNKYLKWNLQFNEQATPIVPISCYNSSGPIAIKTISSLWSSKNSIQLLEFIVEKNAVIMYFCNLLSLYFF